MNYLIWFGIIFGFGYFLVHILYVGISSSFAWFWFGIGVLGLLLKVCQHYVIKNEIQIPHSLHLFMRCVIVVGFFVFLCVECVVIKNANQIPKKEAKYMIVLGAKVRGTTITKSLKSRLDTAYTYLSENPNTRVIVSGGQGNRESISEAKAMQKYLLARGIAKQRIWLEDKSVNTGQNIKYSRAIIKDDNTSVVIVTNGFHIYRATSIGRKQGLRNVSGLAAPSDTILLVSYYVREGLAVIKYKLTGLI